MYMFPTEGHSQAEFLGSQLEHNESACVQTHVHIQIYAKKVHKYEYSYGYYIHALSHFFFGVGFESALDPERPFSVLSIPDEDTRHSLLQWGWRKTEGDKVRTAHTQQLKETFQACFIYQ